MDQQTVANYIKKGLLQKFEQQGKGMYVTGASVQRLLQDIDDIRSAEEAIERCKRELKEAKEEDETIVRQAEMKRNSALYLSKIMNKDALEMYEFFFGNLMGREEDVMRPLAQGCTPKEVADNVGLTTGRVKQIFSKTLDRMHKRIGEGENYLSIELKYRRLQQKVIWLEKKFEEANVPVPEERDVLFTPITEFGLSVRCLKCCHYADIKTPHDLTEKKLSDLIKSRCIGRKTIEELDDLMEELGITFKPEQ